jgi:hypothetical protein
MSQTHYAVGVRAEVLLLRCALALAWIKSARSAESRLFGCEDQISHEIKAMGEIQCQRVISTRATR